MNFMRFFGKGTGAPETPLESGKPIRFVFSDQSGRLSITDKGLKMLQSLKEPVAIVSVCGRFNQGKSFLLNHLLGTSNGFEVAADDCPCTDGLWLWSTPLRKIAPDGTPYNLLFMDTEAIDTVHYSGTQSIQKVSLAVLLSSMLIYNQMGGIDDVALHLISRAIEMTKHIHLQASQMSGSIPNLNSPVLLFLLRDFYLGLVDTPKAYLERTMRAFDLVDDVAAVRNQMRASIRDFFPERECCTLLHHVIDENDCQRLDKISPEGLRPEFRDGLASLRTLVIESTVPKFAGRTVITGPIILELTQLFIDVLNRGLVPSTWKDIEEAECLKAYTVCERIFKRKFNYRLKEVVSKEVLEDEIEITTIIFDEYQSWYGPFPKIYRSCFQSAMQRKILARCAHAERLAQSKAEERAKILSIGHPVRQKKPAVAGSQGSTSLRYRDRR